MVAMGLLSFLFGSCSKPDTPQPSTNPLPEITADIEEEGFVDLTFSLASHRRLSDGSQVLRALGMHRGVEVGLEITLSPKWKQGKLDAGVPIVTHQGLVSYRSIGERSDALIVVLDELYGTSMTPETLRAETRFTAISLEGEPANLAKGPTKIKLFYETDDEDRYAELFTNIDLSNGIVQFREKDPEYRAALIRALHSEK